jgi:prophage DNA circulation protein
MADKTPWRQKLQPAKFRDAAFFVAEHEAIHGRRLQVHEYPLRDLPFAEDLGRKGKEFQLTAYVIGPDYTVARDALIKALDAPGTGTLVHRYLGVLTVAVKEARQSESTNEGGMAWFQITFVESSPNTQPNASRDTRSVVTAKAAAATAAEEDWFGEAFDTAGGYASFVAEHAAELVSGGVGAFSNLLSTYGRVPSPLTSLLSTAQTLRSTASTLIGSPGSLASRWTGLLSGFRNAVVFDDYRSRVPGSVPRTLNRRALARKTSAVSPAEAMAITLEQRDRAQLALALRKLGTATDALADPITATTINRERQVLNQTTLLGLFRRTALIEEVAATAERSFDAYDAARAVMDDLVERLDAEAETAPDDTIYTALVDLRTALVTDLAARAANLSRVSRYAPTVTLPALALAHRLYGDAEREADLIARNPAIRHPGFVRGGEELEVLADA